MTANDPFKTFSFEEMARIIEQHEKTLLAERKTALGLISAMGIDIHINQFVPKDTAYLVLGSDWDKVLNSLLADAKEGPPPTSLARYGKIINMRQSA